MQIVKRSSFTYPTDITNRYNPAFFQPIIDYKFQIRLFDGNSIEAGVFKLLVGSNQEMHACISIQAGCKFGCAMCTSGRNGFVRNLTKEEVFTQVKLLANEVNITVFDHVVFMGIGEPLDNYDNFVGSVASIVDDNSNYAGRLSFATVGLPQKLLRLLSEPIPMFRMLWISLHAPSDEKRVQIMPVDKAFPVQEILGAAKKFAFQTSTEVWINYMLFRKFNDGFDDAKALTELLHGTENIFSIMITEPNNNLPQYVGADIADLCRFEEYLKDIGIKNRVARFIAAGKQLNAGCGEFIFTRI